MMWNRSWVKSRCVLLLPFFLLSSTQEHASALEFILVERGPEGGTVAELWVWDLFDHPNSIISPPSTVDRLVSPKGGIFTPDSVLESRSGYGSLLQVFGSVEDAFNFMTGNWEARLTPQWFRPPLSPSASTFSFTIDGSVLDSIDRTAPQVLNPSPGMIMRSGSPIELDWEFPSHPDPPTQLVVQQKALFRGGIYTGGALLDTQTDRPGTATSSSGTGDSLFLKELVTIPGEDSNRFLLTYEASETALPFDVEVSFGTYISPDNAIELGDTSSLEFSSPPFVKFNYSRLNDPVVVTLANIPEPTTCTLALAALSLFIRRDKQAA